MCSSGNKNSTEAVIFDFCLECGNTAQQDGTVLHPVRDPGWWSLWWGHSQLWVCNTILIASLTQWTGI